MSEIKRLSTLGVYTEALNFCQPDMRFDLFNSAEENGELASPVSSNVEYEKEALIQAFKRHQQQEGNKLDTEQKEKAYGDFMIYNVLQDESTEKADEDILLHKDDHIYGMLETDIGLVADEEINRLLK